MTTGEIDAVCDRYGLGAYKISEKIWLVWGPGGHHQEFRNLDLDTMTPDEFENLVLPMVIECAFCS